MSEEYPDEFYEDDEDFIKLEKAVEELANKVVNLAVKLDQHMNEADAHHVALLAKKKK